MQGMNTMPPSGSASYERSGNFEAPTDLRYSLANDRIGSMDYTLPSSQFLSKREVHYAAQADTAHIRQEFLEKNLILGMPKTQPQAAEQVFEVPPSARLLEMDASTTY